MKRRAAEAGQSGPAGDRGAVVLWSLGLLLMLFFAGGLALDLWRVLSRHGTLSGIAYKSAVAGAAQVVESDLYRNAVVLDPDLAGEAALRFAEAQPDWDASMTLTSDANGSGIVVEITETVPLTLMRMFAPTGGITVTVTARASPAEFE
ncbi:hypothetical protein [Candidatus Spongiisocius sp.]|uniref:hypothetical protein n=1 Tax=Candidatus Spongiisocius sp. TaxID=3101273 RepID=UPI003B59FC5E